MRSAASDPAWARYYSQCSRVHLQYNEHKISLRELQRKIEAARRYAYATQKGG